jgi:hypothetical protein
MVNLMYYGCSRKLRTQFAEGRQLEAVIKTKLGALV